MVKRLIQFSVMLVAVIGLMIAAWPVYAADVSDAIYIADVVATNSGGTATEVAVAVDINTQALIDGEYVTEDLLNTALQTPGGSDIPFMPGVGSNPWVYWLSSVGANESKPYTFYCGGPAMQTGFRYFPGDGGMTAEDADSLELDDNFRIEQKGYVNTDYNGIGEDLAHKKEAIRVYISDDEEITAEINGALISYAGDDADGDIYATNETYSTAQAAASGTSDDSGEFLVIGQSYAGSAGSQSQTTQDNDQQLYNGSATRAGERVDDFAGLITSVQFYLKKYGAPTGTAYCRVYRVDDDALLGTIGTLDVSTLTTSYAWKTFNSTPVPIVVETDIRIVLEYSGGISANHVLFGFYATDGSSWGVYTKKIGVGSWTDSPTYDATFQNITYTAVYYVSRGFPYFDTSAIPDTATVTGASVFLHGYSDSSSTDFDLTAQSGMPTYPHDPLVDADYDKTNYSGDGGAFPTSGFSTSGYNEIQLNSTGYGWVNLSGTTKLCIRSDNDITATAPTGSEYVIVYSADYAGTDHDPYLMVSYYDSSSSVTAENIESGVRTVVVKADGANFAIEVYDESDVLIDSDTTALSGDSVAANDNDWSFLANGSMPYMDYHKIWVDGTLKQHIVYERDATFQDQTAYNNDATPTFITATTDPDITAIFENFRPTTEMEYTGGLGGGEPELITTIPDEPPEFYGEEGEGFSHVPGAEGIETMLEAGNFPLDFFWIWFCFGAAALGVVLSYHFIRSSLLFPAVAGFIIIFFSSMVCGGNPIPMWTIIPYSAISAGYLVSERVFGW